MRTFAGTLLLEDIFDYVPQTEVEIYNLGQAIFKPNILIVETDCGTTLGKFESVNFEAEGLTELATETPLSYNRITQLLSAGVYSIATRHTSTCISRGGVCKKCYRATFPSNKEANVLDRVDIPSEYSSNNEILEGKLGVLSYTTKTDPSTYIRQDVFFQGQLLRPGIDYTFSNSTLNLTSPLQSESNIVVRFMKIDKTPFLGWLAATYSGSLLGMQPIPYELLPLRPLFLASLLLENRLQLVSELIQDSSNIPKEYAGYLDSIRDPLEKALYMLVVFTIYNNVSS